MRLVELYRLDPKDCIDGSSESATLGLRKENITHLYPLDNGNYDHPDVLRISKRVSGCCDLASTIAEFREVL
jgi:hypothetical protein